MKKRGGYFKTHPRGNIKTAMTEKYLHSIRAFLFKKGKLDEAIKFSERR